MVDLTDFYTSTLGTATRDLPGALQQMQQGQRDQIGMSRSALDQYQAAVGKDDGVNIPLMQFAAAIGAPSRGGMGGALASGMSAYAGALSQQRQQDLSKAEKLAIIQQGLAKLRGEEAGIPFGGVKQSLGIATDVGNIDVLRSAAQDRGAYERMFGGGAGGVLPPLAAPAAGPNVAQAAETAAATGQVVQPSGDRLPAEAMQRYMRNRQIIDQLTGSRDPRAAGRVRQAQEENEAMVPKGVFVRADGSLDTTALRIQSQAKKAEAPLSATDRKAILEADEKVADNQSVITSLDEASEVSKGAYGNPIGKYYSRVGQFFGDDAAKKTVELENLTTAQALQQLKSTFGAAPTEGERKILLEIQGSAGLPDEQRQKIFARARAAAEKRMEFNRQQAEQMRGGTYYKPGQGPTTAPPRPTTAIGDPLEAEMRRRGLIK